MAAKYSTKTDIELLHDKEIFFDANVLIYIFWPTASHNWEQYYASAFAKLLKQKNTLVVDFISISEFINRAMRIEHDKFINEKHYLSYKTYRNSDAGQQVLTDIFTIIRENIFMRFEVVAHRFFKPDILKLLEVDNLDFADKSIVEICIINQYVLLTNDADFINSDLEILTSNPAILKN